MGRKEDLVREEDEAWAELRQAVTGLTAEAASEVGYQEGWSAKDALAHLACWLAEAAQALEQMRMGTYRAEDLDEDALNERFLEACRDLDLDAVWVQLHSARARLLQELEVLPEERLDEEAVAWFRDNGPRHYREHLPRLREWLAELAR